MLELLGFLAFLFIHFWLDYKTLIVFGIGVIYGKFYWDGSENNSSRKLPFLQEMIGNLTKKKWLVDYQIIYEEDVHLQLGPYLSGEKSAIFSASPHSTIAIGSFCHALSEAKWRDGVTLFVHRFDFAIPLLREFFQFCGTRNASRENILYSLKEEKKSVYVVIGGTREMMSLESDTIHRGLLEIAFQEGKLVFPVLHEGQENVMPCLRSEWLDQYVRKPLLGRIGYAFPSLCFPYPSQKMTTHIYPPMNPQKYQDEEKFISAYYECVKKYESSLSHKEKHL